MKWLVEGSCGTLAEERERGCKWCYRQQGLVELNITFTTIINSSKCYTCALLHYSNSAYFVLIIQYYGN